MGRVTFVCRPGFVAEALLDPNVDFQRLASASVQVTVRRNSTVEPCDGGFVIRWLPPLQELFGSETRSVTGQPFKTYAAAVAEEIRLLRRHKLKLE